MPQSVLNTPLINYHLVLTLKSQISFKLLSFVFWLKKTLTLLTMLVKSKQYKRKVISESISLIQSKNMHKFQVQLPAVFNFYE